MSALLARVNLDGAPVDGIEFARAASAQAQYGRDGGLWIEGAAALAQAEGAPRTQGSRVLACDARIDGREELGRRLGWPPGRSSGVSAEELILAAYERWGERCPEHLLGDYAFALWDAATRQLFCARDHIGARPLYVHQGARALVVASDVRAIEAFADVDSSLDEEAVARYLCWLVPSARSFLRAIRPLPPGHALLASGTRFAVRPYWSPGQGGDVRRRDPRDYAREFRALLETAVADRLQDEHPVGVHLSGGLDSTGVAVLAQRALKARGRAVARAYAWTPELSDRYPEVPGDERRLIDEVCRREGMQWSGPEATADDFRASLARDLATEGATDLFEERAVMQHAAGLGIRTLLSGWGGDEAATYPGNGYPAWLLTHGRWIRLLDLLRRESGGLRQPRRVLDYAWHAAVAPLLPDVAYARTRLALPVTAGGGFIGPELAGRFPAAVSERHPLWRETGNPRDRQVALLSHGHLARRMETWAHWSAQFGLVYAYPLTDRRLLDYVLGLPVEVLYAEGHWRHLFRSALADVLPDAVAWRRDKWDPVNEAKRQDLRAGCWTILAREVAEGTTASGHCPWLDLDRLRRTLQSPPGRVGTAEIPEFAAARVAVRVWHLARTRAFA